MLLVEDGYVIMSRHFTVPFVRVHEPFKACGEAGPVYHDLDSIAYVVFV
jgi:hypothetical protein